MTTPEITALARSGMTDQQLGDFLWDAGEASECDMIRALNARVLELTEALRPLAGYYEFVVKNSPKINECISVVTDPDWLECEGDLSVEDLRRAADALKGASQ